MRYRHWAARLDVKDYCSTGQGTAATSPAVLEQQCNGLGPRTATDEERVMPKVTSLHQLNLQARSNTARKSSMNNCSKIDGQEEYKQNVRKYDG